MQEEEPDQLGEHKTLVGRDFQVPLVQPLNQCRLPSPHPDRHVPIKLLASVSEGNQFNGKDMYSEVRPTIHFSDYGPGTKYPGIS